MSFKPIWDTVGAWMTAIKALGAGVLYGDGAGNITAKTIGSAAGNVAAGDHTHAQLHDAATVTDSTTINMDLTGQDITADAIVQMSITSDASGLKLSNDSAAPGNNKVYGTDADGVKGFKDDPAGGGVAGADTNVQYNDGGVAGGDANFTWTKGTKILAVTGQINPTFPTGTSNMIMGTGAGEAIAAGGNYHTAFGISASTKITTNDNSSAFGYEANCYSTGADNCFFGYQAGKGVNGTTDANTSCGFGSSALLAITTGDGNNAFGYQAGIQVTTSNYNCFFGYAAGNAVKTGNGKNIAVGYKALYGSGAAVFTSQSSVAVGYNALYKSASGSNNTAIGSDVFTNVTTGNYNTAIGAGAGYTLSTSDSNVFLGYQSGYYETGASKLFIDNTSRGSEADGRIKALIYGVFAATVAAQSLTINGRLILQDDATQPPLNITERSTAPSTPNAGDIYLDDGTNTGDSTPGFRRWNGAAWEDL